MKRFFLFLISFLIGVGLFIWIGRTIGWQEIKRSFLMFTGWQGLLIFLLTLIWMSVGTWKWKEILRCEDVNIPFSELFWSYLAGFSILYFFPIMLFGGETLRAYIIKRKSTTSISKGMASVLIDRILDWTTNLIVAFFGTTFFFFKIGLPPQKLALILFGSFLFWIIGISFFYIKTFKRESMAKFFLNLFNYKNRNDQPLEIEKEIFNFFKIKKSPFWKGLGLAFLEELVIFLRTWFLIGFLKRRVDFLSTLSIVGFSYLATMIPIPASLGIHEAFQAFAFGALGLGASFGTAYTLIIRGAEIIMALIGMGILFRSGLKLFGNNLSKNEI